MDNKKRERIIDKLLVFFKSEAERHGRKIHQIWFDFKPIEKGYYMGGDEYEEPEGEHLQVFKKNVKVTSEEIDEILKYCNTHGYLKAWNLTRIELTDLGFARAVSIENSSKFQKFKYWLDENLRPVIIGILGTVIGGLVLLYLTKGAFSG